MLDRNDQATTIAVGVDGTPRSEDPMSFAGRLAAAQPARYCVGAVTLREDAASQLAAGVAAIPADVDVEPVLRDGSPARELTEATRHGMLFVGGYGPLRAVLVGGVSGAVLRDAARPVVVTPRGAVVDTHATTAGAAAAAR